MLFYAIAKGQLSYSNFMLTSKQKSPCKRCMTKYDKPLWQLWAELGAEGKERGLCTTHLKGK